jgi:hypothetical protein
MRHLHGCNHFNYITTFDFLILKSFLDLEKIFHNGCLHYPLFCTHANTWCFAILVFFFILVYLSHSCGILMHDGVTLKEWLCIEFLNIIRVMSRKGHLENLERQPRNQENCKMGNIVVNTFYKY